MKRRGYSSAQSSSIPLRILPIVAPENPREARKRVCFARSAGVSGSRPNFLRQTALRTREFGFAQLRAGLFDERLVDRVLLQFADDPARAQSRRAPMNQTFGETRIGQPVFGFAAHRARCRASRFPRRTASACAPVRCGCIHGGTDSRARGLSATVPDVGIFWLRLARVSLRRGRDATGCRWFRRDPSLRAVRIQTARAADCGPQRDHGRRTIRTDRTTRRLHHAGRPRGVRHRTTAGPCVSRDGYSSSSATSAPAPVTASAMAFTPSDSRIRFSISRAISGFSRRNSRALSLPWPIRSPL